jgi:kelch-like protein 2/3
LFLEQCSNYKGCEVIFTDGSLKDESAAAAAVSNKNFNVPLQLRLPDGSSVYSAELRAIILALKRIYQSQNNTFLVVSDSLSSLEAISRRKITHPLLVDIHDLHTELSSDGKVINFMWAPSHVGIHGNEVADKAAKEALELAIPKFPKQSVPFTDLKRKTASYCLDNWKKRWSLQTENKLFKVCPDLTKPLLTASKTRKEETILTRLHTGHTYFTHAHLLRREDPPWCHACDTANSVKHFLSDCADLHDLRMKFFGTSNLKKIFTEVAPMAIMSFLKETNLFLKI